ncbi:MAG: spherulation-specific family 4 protein [Burkholderiaceae bacterium]
MKSKAIVGMFLAAVFIGQGLGESSYAQRGEPSIGAEVSAGRLELIVPAYFYPGSEDTYWAALSSAAQQVPLTAILNPASGPGVSADSNYLRVTNDLRAAGGRVIGYIHTSYGNRPLTQVQADINRYLSLYPDIDGFFVDEMSNQNDSTSLTYYANLYGYIKAMNSDFRVVGNPGTNTAAQYLSLPAADAVINFESAKQTYNQYEVFEWVYDVPAEQFGHLVYKSRDAKAMRNVIKKAIRRNAGMVYVTNDKLNNPWDSLPFYWNEQVNCVKLINEGARSC